jgi:hypothetical protein
MMKRKTAPIDELDSAIAGMMKDPNRGLGSVVRVNVSESLGVIFLGVISLALLGALMRTQSKYQAVLQQQAGAHKAPGNLLNPPEPLDPPDPLS